MQEEKDIIVSNNELNTRTRRIVSNSLMLFMRMMFMTIVNLYSVRYILKGLGEVNYGVFNSVAGVVLVCSFLIPVIASSVQRFYSYSLGKNDSYYIESLFAASCNITIGLICIVFVFLETAGLWYINNKLNIPVDNIPTINYIYQITIASFICTLCLIPFTAPIFSHEDMGIYAILSCIECAAKFIVAILIVNSPVERLLFYTSCLLFISVSMLISYSIITCHRYKECRYRIVKDKRLYKEIMTFSGWTLYGALSGVGQTQGCVILLNFFFGPLANAAFAVASNLYNALSSLANSIALSFKPAMVKIYAEGNSNYLERLFYINNKLLFYIICGISIPFVFEMDYILYIWLEHYSDNMLMFSRLYIIYTAILVLHNPITTIIQSTGDIKKYFLFVETIMLSSIPLSYILFSFHLPEYYIFISMITLCMIAHFIRLFILRQKTQCISIRQYMKDFLVPGILIITLTCIATYFVYINISFGFIRFAMTTLTSIACIVILAMLFVVKQEERKAIISIIKNRAK